MHKILICDILLSDELTMATVLQCTPAGAARLCEECRPIHHTNCDMGSPKYSGFQLTVYVPHQVEKFAWSWNPGTQIHSRCSSCQRRKYISKTAEKSGRCKRDPQIDRARYSVDPKYVSAERSISGTPRLLPVYKLISNHISLPQIFGVWLSMYLPQSLQFWSICYSSWCGA